MKKTSIFLLLFCLAAPAGALYAQDAATALDSLSVELWPDYDRASVLVLLTGTLPGDTKLPAAVTVPLPEAAQLNAVARIDAKDGQMKTDIVSSPGPAGWLHLVTPDLRFRVEYYLPYTANGSQRSFEYTWLADLPVAKLQLRVQQPLSASFLKTDPETGNAVNGTDGFDYYIYPVRAVPAGQPFSVKVTYEMAAAQLSAESPALQKPKLQTPGSSDRSRTDGGFNWSLAAMVAGSVIVVLVLTWQVASCRRQSGGRQPLRAQTSGQSGARFCRNCGEPADAGDNFCRRCGKDL